MWVLWISECLSVRGHKSVPHRLKRKLEQKLLCLRMHGVSEHSSVLMRDCASRVSSLWECIMAKEHVCQWEDKLKQDVLAPRSFEGVPHHTSDSAEGRSTTIKGHSVYLNLPASACQMFQSFSFISSHEPYFSLIFFFFRGEFVALHFFTLMRNKNFVLLEGRRGLNLNIVSFASESSLRLKDLGVAEADKVHWSPLQACLCWWRCWYHRDLRGWDL